MRLLVTGGSGFIGTNVVGEFLARGHDVCSVDIVEPKTSAHRKVFRRVDIMDASLLERVFADFAPTTVIHLAARADMEQRKGLDHFAPNIKGVEHVIAAIRKAGTVERSIFASTRLVFDLGHSPRHETDYRASTLYGQSKAIGEDIVRHSSDCLGVWTIVRPTGIWGPWFGEPYYFFFSMIRRGIYVHPGHLAVRKSYGYVGNIVHQLDRILTAAEREVGGKTFWLCDYDSVLVREWADAIADSFDSRRVRSVPVSALRTAAKLGDGLTRIGIQFPMTSFRFNNMTHDMVYDASETERVVGHLPFTLNVATNRTVEWMMTHEG